MREPGPASNEREDPLAEIVPAYAPAGQLVALLDGVPLFAGACGAPDDNESERISAATLFDLASLTKLFTALAFMKLVERGDVELDGQVLDLLPAFGGKAGDGRHVTWRALLAHTSGLPAGVDLGDLPPRQARAAVLDTVPDTRAATLRYSDVGFILLGFAIEDLTGHALDRALEELVLRPAGLPSITYLPDKSRSIAPTERGSPGGQTHLRGDVHDENARALGRPAGHAGLFGTATDLAALGAHLLANDGAVLAPGLVDEMRREQARDDGMRRGLGFSLWSPDPEATSNPFGPRTFGHTGYTGTSLWIDPDRRLVVALLANAVFRGRDFEGFFAARIRAHRAIVAAADAAIPRRVEAAHETQ
jgi:serine-type D-Ala-D-Ala carboxypeptidase